MAPTNLVTPTRRGGARGKTWLLLYTVLKPQDIVHSVVKVNTCPMHALLVKGPERQPERGPDVYLQILFIPMLWCPAPFVLFLKVSEKHSSPNNVMVSPLFLHSRRTRLLHHMFSPGILSAKALSIGSTLVT